MPENIIKVIDEYEEAIMFCKFLVGEKLNHRPEMGRNGEEILKRSLKDRCQSLQIVSGFVAIDDHQSPQCDIMVCRQGMQRRCIGADTYIVEPEDCLMVIEVKSNLTKEDFDSTIEKNKFFKRFERAKDIKLGLFAYKSRMGKNEIYKRFGYKYDSDIKTYVNEGISTEQALDLFVCLHRKTLFDSNISKQLFFVRDSEDAMKYECLNEVPVMKYLWNLTNGFQRR